MTDLPMHIEIRNFIAFQIIEGKLKDGDKLYDKEFFISKFRVNPSYIERAYQQMIEDGFLQAKSDYYYLIVNDDIINTLIIEFANDFTNEFLDKMQRLGYDLTMSCNFLLARLNANG
ncbi:MAG: hypothetical protein PUG67_07660 [Peptoniphilaceae bacterium]|nr:hypothetical protein [Peptoniphilaceae bacterium]MDY6019315.1 hypothetical protein [Anaerococcus sp.]